MRGIAVEDRRAVLRALTGAGSLPVRGLARRLAARFGDASTPDGGELRSAQTKLVHTHLPVLQAAGLVAWNRDAGVVDTTDHAALTDPRFERLLETETEGVDDVLAGLAHEYRRMALTLLWERERTMERNELAAEIHRYREQVEGGGSDTEADVAVALHHTHLPKLSAANVVEYDARTGQAAYSNHPALEAVFGVIYAPETQATDRLDGFLGELRDSYRETEQEASHLVDWPHHWRQCHYG